MKTLGINSNNDIYLDSSNNLVIDQGLQAMADIYTNKSQTILGECQYDTEKGIDFFNTIFASPTYFDLFQNELMTQLQETDDTISVSNFQENIQKNVYNYSVNILSTYGEVTLNG